MMSYNICAQFVCYQLFMPSFNLRVFIIEPFRTWGSRSSSNQKAHFLLCHKCESILFISVRNIIIPFEHPNVISFVVASVMSLISMKKKIAITSEWGRERERGLLGKDREPNYILQYIHYWQYSHRAANLLSEIKYCSLRKIHASVYILKN